MSELLQVADDIKITPMKKQDIDIELQSCKLVHKGLRGSSLFELNVNGVDLTKIGGIQSITVQIGVDAEPRIWLSFMDMPTDRLEILRKAKP